MSLRSRLKWGAMIVMAMLVIGGYSVSRSTIRMDCPSSREGVVFVATKKHALALCKDGTSAGSFSIRIGKKGVGKAREGDEKTPLGNYGLGEPRTSARFGIFVPVQYPTPDQSKLGFTGGAIGVHGPPRGQRWLGRFMNTFDTTDGCIGIATDTEMQTIANWIREHRVQEIVIQ